MARTACVEFLKWALPRLGLQWSGYRKVRRQVCRRLSQRMQTLGLGHPSEYKAYLTGHPEEWAQLDRCCTIPISRFFRDQVVFAALGAEVLPTLARSATERNAEQLRCWSAGCASGEEPYSLSILWELELAGSFPELAIQIVATNTDSHLLQRARAAGYGRSSLREVPPDLLSRAFIRESGNYLLRPEFRKHTEFLIQDIRSTVPNGPFDLVMCRNLVFTYFDLPVQQQVLQRIAATLRTGAALVIGFKERLPAHAELDPWAPELGIYRKRQLRVT